MKKKADNSKMFRGTLLVCVCILFFVLPFHTQAQKPDELISGIEEKVQELMEEGDIPGLTLVILRPDHPDYIKGFGYADLENEIPVSADTLFEIGSCTKAFTALAAMMVEQDGGFSLDDEVAKHLPWFKPTYKGKPFPLTIRHFLHHTTGIPFSSVQYIPLGDDENALEQTVKNIKDIELEHLPGSQFKYATINYDVVGYLIEVVTGMKYEDYIEKKILAPLGLTASRVGMSRVDSSMADKKAVGYKVSFFRPLRYDAPPYRGNHPAGYVVSNGMDMARWLKFQMQTLESPLNPLILKTQQRNESVPPNPADMSSYAMGWQVSLNGSGLIYHGGYNPNFMSYLAFNPHSKIAVAVLTNSNSNHGPFIGGTVMNRVQGIVLENEPPPPGNMDKGPSIISIILGIYILLATLYLVSIVIELLKGRRQFEPVTLKKLAKILVAIPIMAPFLFGIYLLPRAMAGVNWEVSLVWSPISFKVAMILLLVSFAVSYLTYIISLIFPQTNKYLKSIPLLLILSVLSGGANAVVIFLISGSLFAAKSQQLYMVYYFGLAMLLYILGRKIIQTRLVQITFDIVYDMRMKLIEKIFHTSYQKFEKLDRGRVFATLNDDTGQIGQSANLIVILLTSIITVIGCFLFLATIAFWATIVTLVVIIAIATLYSIVSQKAQVYLEEARDTRDVYMGLLNGMVDGFKELCIHLKKKGEYRDDVEKSTDDFRNKTVLGMVKFINAFMIGESMLVAVLGAVGFAVPHLFPNIQLFTLMSFIMVLLYLIGPINGILSSIPNIMQLKIAWGRVKGFIEDIPANLDPVELEKVKVDVGPVESISAKGVMFEYENENDEQPFTVGPVDFEAKKGEIIFVIGGNGSGKTTLAKLLTGLYIPSGGSIEVDGQEVNNYQLGEYFSAVFSNYHLFEKLYNIDLENKKDEAHEYLKVLRLNEKVTMEADSFSTIDLSGGQRKRLALLQCYLEDCPIYLFDELAADQDPEFRKFFYRDLLVRMKEKGKIIIAITHDDHYFDVADKVVKMDMGKIDVITEGKTQLRLTQ